MSEEKTCKTDPGIMWKVPLDGSLEVSDALINLAGIHEFILEHDGHEIRVTAQRPSGRKSSLADYRLYSMYCPQCCVGEINENRVRKS